jgi:ATP-dependent RNA helicase DDX3X
MMDNIEHAGYDTPTPVQKYGIPSVFANRDMMACAQTGSGKTAAFLIPAIEKLEEGENPGGQNWNNRKAVPRCLILSPTRELTSQIHAESLKFSYKTKLRCCVVYGGASIREQQRDVSRGCDILVGTPGRLIDMIDRDDISLAAVKILILDEADRMLDMGFEKDIRKIVEERGMPGSDYRQTLMFSATFPKDIRQLAQDFLKRTHLFLKVGRVGSTTDSIKQNIKLVPDSQKMSEVVKDLKLINGRTLVFSETKRDTDSLARFLYAQGFKASGIHGDRSQNERETALRNFKAGRIQILVATDVAARGLDIDDVQHVINYDLPKTIDSYVHRIGRTGRAGNTGVATSYFNEQSKGIAKDLIKLLVEAKQEVPPFVSAYANEPRNKQRYGSYGGGRGGGGGGYGSRPSWGSSHGMDNGSFPSSNPSSGYGSSYGSSYGGTVAAGGWNNGAPSGNSGYGAANPGFPASTGFVPNTTNNAYPGGASQSWNSGAATSAYSAGPYSSSYGGSSGAYTGGKSTSSSSYDRNRAPYGGGR